MRSEIFFHHNAGKVVCKIRVQADAPMPLKNISKNPIPVQRAGCRGKHPNSFGQNGKIFCLTVTLQMQNNPIGRARNCTFTIPPGVETLPGWIAKVCGTSCLISTGKLHNKQQTRRQKNNRQRGQLPHHQRLKCSHPPNNFARQQSRFRSLSMLCQGSQGHWQVP